MKRLNGRTILIALAIAGTAGWASTASAHCDTLDGPVVGAAQRALQTGQIEHALIWVQKRDEQAIRDAYAKARAARATGGAKAKNAEHAFYAALVRVHRQGEGAPYTGLKPAGHIEPPIAAADRALAARSAVEVERMLVERIQAGLRERFENVAHRQGFAPTDVEAGRAYVGAYVDYVHYVERVYDATGATPHTHGAEHAASAAKAATRPAAPAARHGH